jgi:hypothetical protein
VKAAFNAAASMNSWKPLILPFRNVKTIAKSESNDLPVETVAV